MAERLPARTERMAPDQPTTTIDRLSSPVTCRESVSTQMNSSVATDMSSVASNTNNCSADTEVFPSAAPAPAKGKNRAAKTDTSDEWVEQDETGVYLTLSSLPGGLKYLKRVRFRYVPPKSDF